MDIRQEKLENIISEGKVKVNSVLEDIGQEFKLRQDIIVKPDVIFYQPTRGNGLGLQIASESGQCYGNQYALTSHAEGQLLSRIGIPKTYAQNLRDLGEFGLLKDNLDKMTERQAKDGLLIRHIDGTIKGVLSPSYRRMDASPIFEGFVKGCLDNGYVPYDGLITDYRYSLSFIMPEVFSPSEDEYLVFGLNITTSDYGHNALQVGLLALRITCKNLALGRDIMRNVHLGRRFNTEESYLELSDETRMLDTKTLASAVVDITKTGIQYHSKLRAVITRSTEIGVATPDLKRLMKSGLPKEFCASVKSVYESELPVEMLPKEKNLWRLSNAISLVANVQTSNDVKLDGQKVAMDIL